MLTFLTQEANVEAIKAGILAALRSRNFEAEGLTGHLPWKLYHIEIALHELLQEGLVVSYWIDSGAYQRKFYALTEKFDLNRPVMQICGSPEALEKLGEIKLTTRKKARQARAG